MSRKYTVKEKHNARGKKYWIVVNKANYIANGMEHTNKDEADNHCRSINAIFGYDKEDK